MRYLDGYQPPPVTYLPEVKAASYSTVPSRASCPLSHFSVPFDFFSSAFSSLLMPYIYIRQSIFSANFVGYHCFDPSCSIEKFILDSWSA
jgi:hypothetical protein